MKEQSTILPESKLLKKLFKEVSIEDYEMPSNELRRYSPRTTYKHFTNTAGETFRASQKVLEGELLEGLFNDNASEVFGLIGLGKIFNQRLAYISKKDQLTSIKKIISKIETAGAFKENLIAIIGNNIENAPAGLEGIEIFRDGNVPENSVYLIDTESTFIYILGSNGFIMRDINEVTQEMADDYKKRTANEPDLVQSVPKPIEAGTMVGWLRFDGQLAVTHPDRNALISIY